MRVLVEPSEYLLSNAGDSAMLQVALARMRKMWPDATIQVLTDDPARLATYCPQIEPMAADGRHAWVNCCAVHPRIYRHLPGKLRVLSRVIQRTLRRSWPGMARQSARLSLRPLALIDLKGLDRYLDAISNADLVIATGMGGLTDTFPQYAFGLLETIDLAAAKGKTTALVGQGIGPLARPDLVAIAKRVLPKVDFISLREGLYGLPLLRMLGVSQERVVTTGDDAIEMAYERRGASGGNHLGINVRRAYYSAITSTDIDNLRAVIIKVVQTLRCPIVSLPVSQSPEDSDSQSFSDLLQGHADYSDNGACILTPIELIDQIRRCRLVITGSYHAGVFALAQGVPTIGLVGNAYYGQKFDGLAHQFGMGCEVIMVDEDGFQEKLGSMIIRMWTMAEGMRPQLLDRAERQVSSSRAAYEALNRMVRSRIATRSP